MIILDKGTLLTMIVLGAMVVAVLILLGIWVGGL